jgi:hypothetical protein
MIVEVCDGLGVSTSLTSEPRDASFTTNGDQFSQINNKNPIGAVGRQGG